MGRPLVDVASGVVGRLVGQEVLVGDGTGERGVGHRRVQDDDVLRRGDVREGLLEQWEQIGIDQDGAIVGILDEERHSWPIPGR